MFAKIKAVFYIMLGSFLILSLLFYDTYDASLNTISSNLIVSNKMGVLGAVVSDLMMQVMGWASLFLSVLFVVAGGLRLFPHWKDCSIWRILCVVPLFFGLVFLLAPFEKGGVIGNLIYRSCPVIPVFIIGLGWIVWCICFALFLGCPLWGCLKKIIWLLNKYVLKKSTAMSVFEPVKKGAKVKEKIKPIAFKKSVEVKINIPKKKEISGFMLPSPNLLNTPKEQTKEVLTKEIMDYISHQLEAILRQFGVKGTVVRVSPGPIVTLYEFEPAPGVKAARVIGLSEDIARAMSVVSVRMAVIPGSSVIGIEMPNKSRLTVFVRDLVEQEDFQNNGGALPIILGKTIGGMPFYADLEKMPHLLVAGTTGSGKSVGINTMILSLLYQFSPQQCRLIMVDPKMLELSVYNGIPHLLTPVVTEPSKAVVALKWAVREMEDRYRAMSALSVRSIEGYNKKLKEALDKGKSLTRSVQTGFDPETGKPIIEIQNMDLTPLPYLVIIVDEMADLMLVAGKDVEAAIQRLAQMARAAGIHLIMATQRPSVDVITGTIKANFPTRISFQVISKFDSTTILGAPGAEKLLGRGDMLYLAAGQRPVRIHGPFVSDDEIERLVGFLKEQGEAQYVESVTQEEVETFDDGAVFDRSEMFGQSNLYEKAVAVVLRDKKPSISYVQRQLRVGYNRAADLIDHMEKEGIVSKASPTGRREILTRENK